MSLTSRIKKLTVELESLPHSSLPTKKNLIKEFYPFSNERGISVPYNILKNRPAAILPKKTIRAGILIGQSSICSLIEKLSKHCDVLVFADINPYLITHTRKLLSLLMLSTSREDFEKRYEQEKEGPFEYFRPAQDAPDLTMRKKTLGRYHFLHSETNFKIAQDAARKMTFAFSHINLFHKADRENFFNCFNERKCQITFFNATNLYEWDASMNLASVNSKSDWKPNGMKEIFSQMTKHSPIIMHSIRENATELCPLALRISFSYESYLEKNKVAAEKFLLEKFTAKQINKNHSTVLSDTRLTFTPQYSHYKTKRVVSSPSLTTLNVFKRITKAHKSN